MRYSRFLFSVIALGVILTFTQGDLGWTQEPTQSPNPLQSQVPLQAQDPEKEMFWEEEQLLQQLKESEMKEQPLQKQIHSQDRSNSPNIPPRELLGRDMGQRSDQ